VVCPGLHNLLNVFSYILISYQVPKEVGKVGTESPSFIKPVASRKDGIQAMFSKQKQRDSSSSPTKSPNPRSPTKRKLEVSPERLKEPELSPIEPASQKKLKSAVRDDPDQSVSSCFQGNPGTFFHQISLQATAKVTKPLPKGSPKKRKATKVISYLYSFWHRFEFHSESCRQPKNRIFL